MERDNEVKGKGNSYSYGARMHDPRVGRWLSIDALTGKYPSLSPYSFSANNPLSVIDIQGDSLYILFHVTGYNHSDDMFYAAALTRKTDIERTNYFDPKRDKVIILSVQDVSTIKKKIDDVQTRFKEYGPTVEVDIWSHTGIGNGPVGSKETTSDATDGFQMTDEDWGKIKVNWGPNSRMGFLGCNTGKVPDPVDDKTPVGRASFATEISALPNFKNVTVSGLTGSGFASRYTNVENNLGRHGGDFIFKTEGDKVSFSRTYLIGSYRRRENFGIRSSTSLPMRHSKNGYGEVGGYQTGDKKTANK